MQPEVPGKSLGNPIAFGPTIRVSGPERQLGVRLTVHKPRTVRRQEAANTPTHLFVRT